MKLKNIVRYGAVAALMALTMAVMVSCQKQEPAAESEPTDTQLMQEAAGDAKAPFYVLVVGNDSRVGTTQISLEDYADGTGALRHHDAGSRRPRYLQDNASHRAARY